MTEENIPFKEELSEITGFNIDELIEEGRFSTVYHGIEQKTGRDAVVKVEFKKNKYHRLKREIILLKSLKHPNLVKYIKHGKGKINSKGKIVFLAEEYIKGENLETIIQTEGRISVKKSIKYLESMCDFLGYLHKHKRIFVDLKTDNMIINKQGKLKFIDLASVKKYPYEHGYVALGNAVFLGTDWMESEYLDSRSDIYSIGIILYYMLTGIVPFEEEAKSSQGHVDAHASHIMFLHSRDPRPDIREHTPEAPEKLIQIYKKMMAIKRSKRYKSMKEILKNLRKI